MYDRVVKDIFCKKCYQLAVQIQRGESEIKITQGGKMLISLHRGNNILSKGAGVSMKGNKISVRCPSGHKVKIEV